MLENLFKYCNDVVFVLDLAGTILRCNDIIEKHYGYRTEELIGQPFSLLLTPAASREWEEQRESLLFGESPEPVETERLARNHAVLKVSVSYSPVRDGAGKISGILVVERRVSRYRSMASKAQALLETAPDSMVIVNSAGQIILVNAQTEVLFGYKKEELLGREVEILIPGRYLQNHVHHREVFSAQPKTRSMGAGLELFGKKKDGREFPVEISLSPLATEEGVLVSAAIRDISEKKLLEKKILEANINLEKKVQLRTSELERKNRELEQFAYVASHDLQEPLRTTSSFVEMLRGRYQGRFDADADKIMDYLLQSNDRMKTLIRDLLDYSRIGRSTELLEVDCNALLTELLGDMQQSIRESAATLRAGALPVLRGYRTELKLLLQNLISNSLKFRQPGRDPLIEISAERQQNCWQFAVRDNGIGLDPKFAERIFIIFQRLHNRTQYEGSGIGLAHCKKIAELHGGRIWVESTPGQGAVFYFTINQM